MDDSGGDEDFLYYAQPGQAPRRSFMGSTRNPFIDLCTQVTEPENPPRTVDRSGHRISEPSAPKARLLHPGRFATVVLPMTSPADPPSEDAPSLVRNAQKLEAGRIRSMRHRDKIKAGKIAGREEIAELVSNFVAPNQGCQLKNAPLFYSDV